MADPETQGHMSLIPYSSSHGEVVLRHGDTIVSIDPRSQQLTLRDARTETVEHGKCPYCQRSYQDEPAGFPDMSEPSPTRTQRGFVSPEYFRMLAERTPVSAADGDEGGPPSPGRPWRALRSGDSRSASSSGPPSGAEFVGSTRAPVEEPDQGIKGSSFLPGYFQRFFVERRVLGRGGRGVVLLVEHVLDGVSLGDFACKRIPVGNDHGWLAKVLVEVQLLQRLNHPNLVSYRHVWLEDAQTTKFGPTVPCVFILQQLCNGGDLHHHVQQIITSGRGMQRKSSLVGLLGRGSGQLPLDQIFSFFSDIASGLNYLHSSGYIHRDLKPSNCLLHSDSNGLTVLVSDFGEVQVATAQRTSTGATGTISFQAPETLRQEAPGGAYGNFTTKSDVFSLGMILYYMCFGDLPYVQADVVSEENEDIDLLRAEITSWDGFSDVSRKRKDLPEQLYRFLKRLLSLQPMERPSTSDILQSMHSGGELGEVNGSTFGVDEHRVSPVVTPTSSRPGQPSNYASSSKNKRLSFSQTPVLPAPRGRRATRSSSVGVETPSTSGGPSAEGSRAPGSSGRARRWDSASRSSSVAGDKLTRSTSSLGQSQSTIVRRPASRSIPRAPESWQQTAERPPLGARRKSELLLLPPPPSSISQRILDAGWLSPGTRVVVFVFKMASLTYPCSPYMARGLVAYPLLAAAAADLGFHLGWRASLTLLSLHIAVIFAAISHGLLCAYRPWPPLQQ